MSQALAIVSYDRLTRWLHLGLALTVTHQLFISLIMEPPTPKAPLQGLDATLFEMHEWVGVAAFSCVLLHALWSLVGPAMIRWGTMLPLTAAQWALVWRDIQALKQRQLPWPDKHEGLPALVHGLGLLAVLGAGLAGLILFIGLPEDGALTPFLEADMDVHGFMGTVVWAYWLGHVGISVWHRLVGHPIFEGIKPFR